MSSPRPRRPAPAFRPHFTLALLYLFSIFFVFCLLFVAPPLIETFRSLPPGAAQEDLELAARVAQETIQPRIWIALAAAVVTTGVAAWAGVLPGMRRG